ncbi:MULTISPECIES: hypothetical protein [Streptomyces]|uniref:hypothetical protein n=1 Tax=Streptomyces TaxID=1883 RepID=UPI00292EB0D8|nr:hypothetical protein [Streptomyces sp. NEAU-HV9]
MKHRGRHRRRKRGRALRAFLTGTALALTAAATMISASQATVADNPGALKPITSSAETGPLRLQEHLVPQGTLDRLAGAMGRPVGVSAVLKGADRALLDAGDCTAAQRESLPVAPRAAHAYCWDPSDTATPDWRPASVTTSGDADDDGVWGENRVILSGWTHSTRTGPAAERGLARVAFVDADDPARLAYSWVLLVVPSADGRDYRGLASTVSGMVWYQDKLLVTAGTGTSEALYVYDLNRIQRTTVDGPAIGRVPGGWSADGYRYVMPAVGTYRLPAGRCGTDGPPCPGGLSLDRGSAPDSLVMSEWTPAGSNRHARLWRYALSDDPARGGLLAADSAGRVDAVEALETRATGIRGVLAYHPPGTTRTSWYVGRLADSPDRRGSLWRQDTSGAKAARCGSDTTHHCWARGAGSLSYWQATGEVWSLSDRMLFSAPLSSIDSSLR